MLDELRVGRCCLKTFYCATFISVVSQEFVFQKPSKPMENMISLIFTKRLREERRRKKDLDSPQAIEANNNVFSFEITPKNSKMPAK